MEIEIEILKKGTVKVLLDDRNPSTAHGRKRFSSQFPLNMTMKTPHHLQIKEIYPTGHQERHFVSFSEIPNPPLM